MILSIPPPFLCFCTCPRIAVNSSRFFFKITVRAMLIQQFISRSFQIPSAPARPEHFPWVFLLKFFQPLPHPVLDDGTYKQGEG